MIRVLSVVLLIGGIGLFLWWPFIPKTAISTAEHHIRIEAGDYGFTPGVIEVNRGDRVTLELVSTDYVHGIYIDGYDLSFIADPGQPNTLSFIADRSGSFRMRCSVTCGDLHPFMIGKLQVASNGLFWRASGTALLLLLVGLVHAHRQTTVEGMP